MTKKRSTIQKKLILEAVMALQNHPTAEEIYNYIKAKYVAISKATIYSNLRDLAIGGEIKRVDLPNEPTRYDHNLIKEYHFLCKSCKRLFDSDVPYDEKIMNSIKQKSNFQIEEISVILNGLCPDCINKNKENEK